MLFTLFYSVDLRSFDKNGEHTQKVVPRLVPMQMKEGGHRTFQFKLTAFDK